MAPQKRVGLLVGRENTFPGPFIETVNRKGKADGITAELAVLGGTSELAEPYHSVLVDRISQEVPYYRAHMEGRFLMGAIVFHDPSWRHSSTGTTTSGASASDATTSSPSATTPRRRSKSATRPRTRLRAGSATKPSRTREPWSRRSAMTWTRSSSRSKTASCTPSTS